MREACVAITTNIPRTKAAVIFSMPFFCAASNKAILMEVSRETHC